MVYDRHRQFIYLKKLKTYLVVAKAYLTMAPRLDFGAETNPVLWSFDYYKNDFFSL